MARFSSTTAISIFLNTGEPCYVNLLKLRYHEKCIHGILKTGHFTHSQLRAFQRPSEQIFFNKQSDSCVLME